MAEKKIIAGILMDENSSITFVEVCEQYEIAEEELLELVEHGIVEIPSNNIKRSTFDYYALARIQSALRIKYDLGINTPGVALALELLDQITELQDELDILKRHVNHL
ncbi:chaperone modulator CbpM [Legionella impletisoli]|uniref:Molecular chaperone n=1 Tax=Legionella impletisoli TaxID=343510 RepID=A0A917NCQ1_9GAMM|nr:chaperone modulator CbpM [Legionella impletisoli]GGI88594.1 molecular chaperone [Legionella impletisoli]